MDMYLTGALHVALALVALVSGLVMLVMRKGTLRHRQIGWVYAVSMLGLNVTALLIYRLFGRFGPFHIAALLSLVTIIAGLVTVVLRRPRRNWLEHHAYWMSWSYVGLCAAAVSEVATRVPASPFWWMVFGSTLVVIAGGRHLINSRVPIALQRMRGRPAVDRSGPDAGADHSVQQELEAVDETYRPDRTGGELRHSRHPVSLFLLGSTGPRSRKSRGRAGGAGLHRVGFDQRYGSTLQHPGS
jgi:uncharacterized membrane protein